MKERCVRCKEERELEDYGIQNKGDEPTGFCARCIGVIKYEASMMPNQIVLGGRWFDPPAFWKNIRQMRKADIAMRRA